MSEEWPGRTQEASAAIRTEMLHRRRARCDHDVATWWTSLSSGERFCECGMPVPSDEQVRRLMVLLARYEAEDLPAPATTTARLRDCDFAAAVVAAMRQEGW